MTHENEELKNERKEGTRDVKPGKTEFLLIAHPKIECVFPGLAGGKLVKSLSLDIFEQI